MRMVWLIIFKLAQRSESLPFLRAFIHNIVFVSFYCCQVIINQEMSDLQLC